jgi:hypothetical protein
MLSQNAHKIRSSMMHRLFMCFFVHIIKFLTSVDHMWWIVEATNYWDYINPFISLLSITRSYKLFTITIHHHYSPLLFTITIHRYYSPTLFIIVTIHCYYSSSLLFIDDTYNYFSVVIIHRWCSSIIWSPQISTTHPSCCPVHLRPARPIFQLYELRWLWFSFQWGTSHLVTHPRFLQVEHA